MSNNKAKQMTIGSFGFFNTPSACCGVVYSIGVYSPLPAREKALKDKGMKTDEIYKLIDRDSGEEIYHFII
jgi:ClpP class serine protease